MSKLGQQGARAPGEARRWPPPRMVLPEDARQAGDLADELWKLIPDDGCQQLTLSVPLVLAIYHQLRVFEGRAG